MINHGKYYNLNKNKTSTIIQKYIEVIDNPLTVYKFGNKT